MGVFDRKSSDGLRQKYNHAIQTAKSLRMQGAADERDGKLYFNGTVNSESDKNQIWDAIKTVPDWQLEVVADIRVNASSSAGQTVGTPSETPMTTYKVQPGDTLSGIAKRFLGDASEYMVIFNANRDQLSDPDRIQPGQDLKIPQHADKRA